MDPMGMIPQYVVNSFAPSKGMEVKKFVDDWPGLLEMMKQREAKQFKRDHEPLFDAPHPKLTYIEAANKESNGKGNEADEQKEAAPDNQ